MDISFPNQKKLQLEAAIMIYKQKSGYYSDGTYAAILHKIESNGRFLPGKNLDTNAFLYYFNNPSTRLKITFQAENVLGKSYDSIVWYEKSRLTPIYFQVNDREQEINQKLNSLSGKTVLWPPLLFMIRGTTLYCKALNCNRRPTLKSKLFVAPFTHINESNGAVCLPSGVSIDRQKSLEENMANISEYFYQGIFGHKTGSMQQIKHPGGHDGFWIEYMQKEKYCRFPVNRLIETNQTLEDFLK